jgi:hypothetical protein
MTNPYRTYSGLFDMRLHQFGLIQQTIAAFESRIIRATC